MIARRLSNARPEFHSTKRGETAEHFSRTDVAGPTNEALGPIELSTLAGYEQYRNDLAHDADHKKNLAVLEQSGAIVAMNRSIIQRLKQC
jgi:hypothetical protein